MFHKFKLVSFLAALTAMLIACGSEPPPVSTEVPRVKYFEVGETTAGQLRRLSGKLVSEDTASLSFTVSGTVESVLVAQGQDVARSQVLARLDPEPTQIAVNQARAQVSIMRAQHLEAEQNYQRISDLFTRGYSTKAEREAAEAEYAQAGGNLAAAESDLERSERDLVRTELIAPFAGSIGSRSVEPFQEVAVGEEVFVLQSDQALKVELLVPETLIRHVEYGQPVEIEFPSLDEEVLRGQVNEIGSRAASGNAFPVSVQLFSTTPELRVGMTAGVTFNFDNYLDGAPIYLIPISSLAIDYGTVNFPIDPDNDAHVAVFVIGEGNVLEVRKIIVNGLRGDMFEVFKGLKPGDKVVSAGVSFVREGMKVELWSPEMGLKRG
jgi:RND family efflux transporter MFP subunit